jgi:hypothetical protein
VMRFFQLVERCSSCVRCDNDVEFVLDFFCVRVVVSIFKNVGDTGHWNRHCDRVRKRSRRFQSSGSFILEDSRFPIH